MKRTVFLLAMVLFFTSTSAHAYEVTQKSDQGDAIYYTISCKGGKAKIKFLKSNSGWYVAGFASSNYNYRSMDTAAKAACKYAK